MKPLREAAIEYAQRGWHVFPLLPKSKQPNSVLVPRGYLEASDWAPDCLYWWEREPCGNIGLSCRASGLIVIDIDPRDGGYETMLAFEDRYTKRNHSVDTLRQTTPTGGEHLVFKHPGVDLKGHLGPGVDIKDHGYILLQPSVHPAGGEYAWTDGWPLIEPWPMPEAWVAALEARQEGRKPVLSRSGSPLLSIPAEDYCSVLTGREVYAGWMKCPFHKEGNERTPSLKVQDTMWACFACEPLMGKQVMGGNILDFAGLLKHHAMPLRGTDLRQVKDEMEAMFCGALGRAL